MKNLFLHESEKYSPLQLKWNNELHVEDGRTIALRSYLNIYITSDEEIKEGDYYLDFTRDGIKVNHFKTKDDWVLVGICDSKKIILTTDKDLIKDGVQEIDDEFLEWFVENPSCEEVEIYQDKKDYGTFQWYSEYKIIIPKEEPTFYTKKCKCMIFEPNCFTGMCKNCGGILKEETKPKTMFESLQEYFKNTSKEKVLEDWNEFQQLDEEGITVKEFLENQKQETFVNEKCFKCGRNQYSSRKPFCTDDFCNKDFYQKPKQETLEEAAKKYSENWEETTGLDYENTVPSEVNKLDFINGAKWQQERMYSEEEVHKILGSYSANKEVFSYKYTYNKWFEQFKK